jgi:hypothetical protein
MGLHGLLWGWFTLCAVNAIRLAWPPSFVLGILKVKVTKVAHHRRVYYLYATSVALPRAVFAQLKYRVTVVVVVGGHIQMRRRSSFGIVKWHVKFL